MHPGMAELQGPAIVVYIEGPVITSEEMIKLLANQSSLLPIIAGNFFADRIANTGLPSGTGAVGSSSVKSGMQGGAGNKEKGKDSDIDVKKNYPTTGKRLASTFAVTDCLQILSGNVFCIFDPMGQHLLSQADNEVLMSNYAGKYPEGRQGLGPGLGQAKGTGKAGSSVDDNSAASGRGEMPKRALNQNPKAQRYLHLFNNSSIH
jgi:hypothetical protein